MNFAGLLFVLVAQYLSGKGVLRLLKVELRPLAIFCFSMMLGVPIVSFAPCVLQVLHLRLDVMHVAVSIVVFTVLFSIPLVVKFKKPQFPKIKFPELYEWPFLLFIAALLLLGIWRCFYYPPYARDMLSGPELVAEYAIREHTFINSVYNLDLHTSNNYFKSPFITSLQIIYKLLVTSFGQTWLSVLAVSFIVWLYTILKERLHPLIAGVVMLFFMAMPEVFAYTYVLLYDYSNMIYFFAGFYFLARYQQDNKYPDFLFSTLLFGIATYVRTETLFLVAMTAPLQMLYFYRQKIGFQKMAIRIGTFVLVPAFFYVLCNNVFVKLFVPIPLVVSDLLNPHLADVSAFFGRLTDIFEKIIFSDWGIRLFGYFAVSFFLLLIVDLIMSRKFAREAAISLYGVGVVIIGLALVGYLFPLVDLTNTTKRGLFKMMPLVALYMANSKLIQTISKWLTKWEHKQQTASRVKAAPVIPSKDVKVAQSKPVKVQHQPNKKISKGK